MMRYDELEWRSIGNTTRALSQPLVPVVGCTEERLHWPAYRIVRDVPTDMFVVRCYEILHAAIHYTNNSSSRLYGGFYGGAADLLTLACLLVHLEPAPKE
jgi:hypothetical protein